MKHAQPLKICAGASAGGHMNQLLRLLENSQDWPCQPSFYVTTMEALAEKLREKGPAYVIGECNRNHPLKSLVVFFRAFVLISKERPDVVVTTGSLPLALVCLWGKVFGARIVWIDSVANVECLSVSGRMTRYFADLFLTQWPDIAEGYKNVECVGAIV